MRSVLIMVAALAVGIADIPEGVEPWQPAAALAAVVAAGAVLLRDRARPLGVVVALFAVGGVAIGAEVAGAAGEIPFGLVLVVAVLLADVGLRSPRRDAIAVFGLALVVAVAMEALADARGWIDVVTVVATWGVAVAGALAVRFWRQAVIARSERTRIAERERIARELHDVVAHHVSAIAMTAEGARAVVGSDPELAEDALEAIHGAATTTLDDMRRMVAILRDDPITGDVPQRLADIGAMFADAGGPSVSVSIVGVDTEPPAAVRAALFRIAQEAVTNARRHARSASAVEVAVRGDEGWVSVSVQDDGRPGPSVRSDGAGFGLQGMRERAELLGGRFSAGPRDGGGWLVCAELPVEAPR